MQIMLLAQTANPEGALAVAKKRLGLKDNAHNRFFVAKVYEQNRNSTRPARSCMPV